MAESISPAVVWAAVDSTRTVQQQAPEDVRRHLPALGKRRASILTIVIVAFALRLLVITLGHTYRITPRRDHFQFGWETGRIARSIAMGQGFGSPTDLPTGPSAWTAPVYPYILAGVFKLFGVYTNASAWVILAFNSVFAAMTCWTLYRVAERVFGPSVARGTAWTWAVFPYVIYWPVRVVWDVSLSTFLLSLALWLAIRMRDHARLQGWISYGLLWGLIALTNTALLILLPFILAWICFPVSRRSMAAASICIAVIVLCVAPWTVRNYREFGHFVFIRDNLPLELHEANNESSSALWTRTEHPANDHTAMKRFQELGEYHYMDETGREFRTFLREHPDKFLLFTLERVWYFWAAPRQATIVAGYDLWVARHVQFLLAAIFAFAGLILSFVRRNRFRWLLAPFLLTYPLPYYVVSPFPRYKHPIETVMVMLIVYLLCESRGVRLDWRLRRIS
jgi:4-amino-4-deoxy-L-arabinose transferase-like glycosyltransferase